MLQFADNGTAPFDQASADADDCLIRMQRIADLLVAQDNERCGGVMVTFTGFYRHK
jgi:hypothetical protein